jgi:NitT/TauT family transport system substrate-binding protein
LRAHFCAGTIAATSAVAADIDFGKVGEPVKLVVGYQPYYTESWSGVIMRSKKFYEKYLPKGSTVEFQIGLQGAIIVNNLLAGKQHIGYYGDMPGIVSTTKQDVADIRLVAVVGMGWDQCNTFLVRTDAPKFANDQDAIKWLNGKTVAVPKGSCTDRFAQAVFKRAGIQPSEYLNQNIEVITSNFRAGKLDAAVMWEPTTSRLVLEVSRARLRPAPRSARTTPGSWECAPISSTAADVVKAWLNAELDAQLFFADPKNAMEVVKIAREQTTGFSERALWMAAYGTYPKEVGGTPTRIILPYVFTPEAMELIKRASAFLYEIKSINTPTLRPDAVMPEFAEAVLKERGLKAPLGEIKQQPDSAYTGAK